MPHQGRFVELTGVATRSTSGRSGSNVGYAILVVAILVLLVVEQVRPTRRVSPEVATVDRAPISRLPIHQPTP